MKKTICKVLSFFVMAAMVFQLSACSSDWNEEKAQQYTEAVLSFICTGKNNTGVEFADLKAEDYESERQTMLDEAMESAGLSSYGVSDETIEKFKSAMDKAMQNVKYDVGTATKTDDGFTVPVTIHPVSLFAGVDTTEIQNKVVEMAQNGEIDTTNTDAIYDKVFELFAEAMEKNLDNPTYGDDYEMTFDITKDSDGNYSASEANGTEFGEHMFSVEY